MKGIPSIWKNLSKQGLCFTFFRKNVSCELRCILRDLKTFYKNFFLHGNENMKSLSLFWVIWTASWPATASISGSHVLERAVMMTLELYDHLKLPVLTCHVLVIMAG